MIKILEARLSSPNNAQIQLIDYLKEKGIKIVGEGRRRYGMIGNKKYAITITDSNKKSAVCRQFSEEYDGLITMHERTGKIYVYDKKTLTRGIKSREFNEKKYNAVKSTKKFSVSDLLDIEQIDTKEFKDMYLQVAQNYANKIVSEVEGKLK